MNNLYAKLKAKWDSSYITEETLRKYVLIGKKNPALGITEEEFEQITGIVY